MYGTRGNIKLKDMRKEVIKRKMVPTDWNKGIIIPVYKSKVTLISGKKMVGIIKRSLRGKKLEAILEDTPCGFRWKYTRFNCYTITNQ